MLLLLALLSLGAAAILVGRVVTLEGREREAAVHRVVAVARVPQAVDERGGAQFRERILRPFGARLAALMLRAGPKTSVDSVRARLLAAGKRNVAPTTYLAFKGGLVVGGVLFGLLVGVATSPAAALGFAVTFGALGFIGPDFVLSKRAQARREAIVAVLPDALDLLAVSVEAGLGFEAAMAQLAAHMKGALVEEFSLALSEMRIGRSRQEALRMLAERVDADEVSSFVRSIIQAEQLGASIGRILAVQAEDARMRRQAAAEEKAMKAPIKMLFPTVLFIFPAMFIVILGPALLNFGSVFG